MTIRGGHEHANLALSLVEAHESPGGNATGINYFAQEVTAKRLGLLHELVPKISAGKFHFEPPSRFTSLDHLVGEQQERFGDREAERLGSLEIDPQFEFRRLDHRQISRLFPAQDTGNIDAGLPVQLAGVRAIA